ncbi:hypothetical protein C4564_05865, partial [Candidatus Microgenomates bacterium]
MDELTRSPRRKIRYSIDEAVELIREAHRRGELGSYYCNGGDQPMIASMTEVLTVKEEYKGSAVFSLEGQPVDRFNGAVEDIKARRRVEAYDIAQELLAENFGVVSFGRLHDVLVERRCCAASELRG